MNNRLLIIYLYRRNTPHCSGNNVCHHQKLKLMFVFMYIFLFFGAANINGNTLR